MSVFAFVIATVGLSIISTNEDGGLFDTRSAAQGIDTYPFAYQELRNGERIFFSINGRDVPTSIVAVRAVVKREDKTLIQESIIQKLLST